MCLMYFLLFSKPCKADLSCREGVKRSLTFQLPGHVSLSLFFVCAFIQFDVTSLNSHSVHCSDNLKSVCPRSTNQQETSIIVLTTMAYSVMSPLLCFYGFVMRQSTTAHLAWPLKRGTSKEQRCLFQSELVFVVFESCINSFQKDVSYFSYSFAFFLVCLDLRIKL